MEIIKDIFSIVACIIYIIEFVKSKTNRWVLYKLAIGTWTENGKPWGKCYYYIYQNISTGMLKLKKAEGSGYKMHTQYQEILNFIAEHNLKIIQG